MLDNSPVFASLPAHDIERARRWYEEKLGLKPDVDIQPNGLIYKTGGTRFVLYQTPFAGTGKHTLAGWVVEDIEKTMTELRARGVTFEEYSGGDDGPKTENGVARDPENLGAAAWFKDSEDNILNLNQLPPGMSFND